MEICNYIIINHFDKPSAKLIAVITKIEKDIVTARYLYSGKVCWGNIKDVTLVESFGVKLIFDLYKTKYKVEINDNNSIATYPDGRKRYWQDNSTNEYKIHKNSLIYVS